MKRIIFIIILILIHNNIYAGPFDGPPLTGISDYIIVSIIIFFIPILTITFIGGLCYRLIRKYINKKVDPVFISICKIIIVSLVLFILCTITFIGCAFLENTKNAPYIEFKW